MESCWKNYISIKNQSSRQENWHNVLSIFLNGSDEVVGIDCMQEFVHHLGKEFLSAIENHCRLHEDEPEKLLDYLSCGDGLLMLLNITFYGDKISSCAFDLCNLLLSIAPLFINVNVSDPAIEDIIPAKIEICDLKNFLHNLVRCYIGLRKGNSYNSSSDEDAPLSNTSCPLESLQLNTKQLFNTVIATIVTLIQSDVILMEPSSLNPFLENSLNFLEVNKNLPIYLLYFHLNLVFAIYNEILNFKDTVQNVLTLTNRLLSILTSIQNEESNEHLYLTIYFYKSFLSCFIGNLNTVKGQIPSISPETSSFLYSVVSGGHLDKIKHTVCSLDKKLQNFDDEQILINYLSTTLEIVFNNLTILSKSTKGLKQWCFEHNHSRSVKFDVRFRGKKRFLHKDDNLSSDEDVISTSSKTDENSDYESDAQDISDFERFSKSSDSHERKVSSNKTDSLKKAEKLCMMNYTLKMLLNILKETKSEEIANQVLRSLISLGLCPCVNIDQYMCDILSCLAKESIQVKERILFLMSHVLLSNQESLLQKKLTPSSTSSSLNRTTPRSQSSVDSSTIDNLELDVKKGEFSFIGELLNQLLQNPSKDVRISILKHLKLLSMKFSPNINAELFHKMFLTLYSKTFPLDLSSLDGSMLKFSEEEDYISSCLQLIDISSRKSNDFLFKFYDFFAIDFLKVLICSDNKKIGLEALHILEYFASLLKEMKNVNKAKSKIKHKDIDDISKEATMILLQTLNCLVIKAIEINMFLVADDEECLYQLMTIVNRLLPQRKYIQNEFNKLSLNYKSIQLFDRLIIEMKDKLQHDVCETSIQYFLRWLKILLPACLNNLNKEAHMNIFTQVQSALLDHLINHPVYCKEALLTLLKASTIQQSYQSLVGDVLNDELFLELKSPSENNMDEEKSKQNFTFPDDHGYEADGESDNDEKKFRRNRIHSFSRKTINISNQEKSNGAIIYHKHLCKFVLAFLSNNFPVNDENDSWYGVLISVMQEIHSYQRNDLKNNTILSKLDILEVIFRDFNFIFSQCFDKDVQSIFEKVILYLCCEEITASQLKHLFQLFKDKNNDFEYLASLLWKITDISIKSLGPSNYLRFPAYFSEDRPQSIPVALQRAQTFMIPKQELNPRRFKSRSHSWSSKYEIDGHRYVPLGFSHQPAAKDLSLITLQLESKFMWPDKDFSISMWFALEDTNNAKEMLLSFDKNKQTFYRCLSTSNSVRFEKGFEELLHLCSFGGNNAMFEVWLGARTGSIHYRWIISNYGSANPDIEYTPFEQVNVPQQISLNKWHHIVVSLSATSANSAGLPHVASIFTIVDGCELETMQMKYPAKSLQSKTTLVTLLGHGLNPLDNDKPFANDRSLSIGGVFIFQGKKSYKEMNENDKIRPVVDKLKAIYLFSLGPDNANIKTEYFGCMNYKSSHIDSSLSWDSIMFREFSFCVNILTEGLIENQFPVTEFFGRNQMPILLNIKHELQTCLLLSYHPQHYYQFYQYIPQLRQSGQIQHIYMSDISGEHKPDIIDGTAIDATLLGEVDLRRKCSFPNAIHQCGGMPVLLYLYALIAESPNSELALSFTIKVLFELQSNCLFLMREMNDCTGYVLFNEAMRLSPCRLSSLMIKSLMESICQGDIFLPSTDLHDISVNINSTAIVRNICLLQSLMKDWHLLMNEPYTVQEILWKVLEVLVRPTHPHQKFNILQYQRARVVENMLIGCQEWREEKPNEIIPESLCKIYLSVITNLLGQPIDLQVFHPISNFLIAIHPTFDTLTLHSPHRFYLNHKPISASNLNVTLRDKSKMVPDRSRRTASFTEGINLQQPMVFVSQEDLSSGAIIQSEVIIRRPSHALKITQPSIDKSMSKVANINRSVENFFDSVDGAAKTLEAKLPNMSPKLPIHKKITTHRRIQSDGNIRFNTSVDLPKLTPKPPLISTESTDYDVISDSEVVSSCEGEPEDYLVVDGFIDQTMESFTPTPNEVEPSDKIDVLHHMRYGLMKVVQSSLTLLPDNLVTRVIGKILKIEVLLVLVNQKSDKIREVALENLYLYLKCGGRDCFENFKRFKGCHLLANQLHQYPITQRIIELCFSLLFMHPVVKINKDLVASIEAFESDSICPAAIIPCLTLLEGCVQKPTTFGMLSQLFQKIFSHNRIVWDVALSNGFIHVLTNIVLNLSTEATGSMNMGWKKETFAHFLGLIDWTIASTICSLQESMYYPYFKKLFVLLQQLEIQSKDKGGTSSQNLFKVSRFLCYHSIHKGLSIFQTRNYFSGKLHGGHLKRDEDYYSTEQEFAKPNSTFSRHQAATRSFFKKIPTSFHFIPTSANVPTEIQEQFLDVLSESIKLASFFGRNESVLSTVLGCQLEFLSNKEEEIASADTHYRYCADLMHWLFKSISNSYMNGNSFDILLQTTKEKLLNLTSQFIHNIISPLRSREMRFIYVKEILKYQRNKQMLQMLLYDLSLSKTQFVPCINSIKLLPDSTFTDEEKSMMKEFKSMTSKIPSSKTTNQKLSEEIREVKRKRREEENMKLSEAYAKIIIELDDLKAQIANQGMDMSTIIVEGQDFQRQNLLRVKRGKQSKQFEARKTWRNLIHHLTQERAPWHCENLYPKSWQLDPTEGPLRMRKRLQRCHLEIEPKFFLDGAPGQVRVPDPCHLSYLFDQSQEPASYSFRTNDTIRELIQCVRVSPGSKIAGEVLIGGTHMYFVEEDTFEIDKNTTQTYFGDHDVISLSWRYEEIRELLKRRYSLRDNAMEIFLTSGRTFLLAFKDTKTRDDIYTQLVSKELSSLVTNSLDLNTLTQRWRNGAITNFEYLTELNKKAGRSFNDLMQYPVFPFILSDYESDVLNLQSADSYRNLSKPIACQDKSKEERYIEMYNYLKNEFEQRKQADPEEAVPPYHYSSHYSNSGTILHFLVRLPPFTSMFLKYQDNQFDIPDRTFHSMSTTWKLSSFVSSTDVKELIPEFFFLEEFLMNREKFDMGVRQSKERVDDVILPIWSQNDSRLFTLIHMQALESDVVSSNLHNWIDLVFGYKQTGNAAIKATNVFHPSTYFGVDVDSIKDEIHRRALQTMIETYGQTPLQLFTSAHPKRFSKPLITPAFMDIIPHTMDSMIATARSEKNARSQVNEGVSINPLPSVSGVQWGDYCGSPAHQPPVVMWVKTFPFRISRIITSHVDLAAYLCAENTCILTNHNLSSTKKPIGVLQWGLHDNLLRISLLHSDVKTLFHPMRPDMITCCVFVPDVNILFVGGTSGVLNVWPVQFDDDKSFLNVVGPKQNLLGHADAISDICVCQEFSIVVTVSEDNTAIIWDLNRLCYIRSLEKHEDAVKCVTISESSGDIATACNHNNEAIVYLWTINAKRVGRISIQGHVECLTFSNLPDGTTVNVLAAGFSDGSIRMWDTWMLKPLRHIQANSNREPITSLCFSRWNSLHLISSDGADNVYLWAVKDLVLTRPPSFTLISPNI